jgi:hypothetical protein
MENVAVCCKLFRQPAYLSKRYWLMRKSAARAFITATETGSCAVAVDSRNKETVLYQLLTHYQLFSYGKIRPLVSSVFVNV